MKTHLSKRILALLLTLAMVLSLMPMTFAAEPVRGKETEDGFVFDDFEDVAPGKYYYDSVYWAYNHGITSGQSATVFGVKQPCTREQVVTFLYAAAGRPEFDAESVENPFTDVKAGKWYYNAVMWAYKEGITGGMTATTFGIGATCTRAQFVTFLYAAKNKPAYDEAAENPFTDVEKGKWYYAPVMWAVQNGVTGGTSATTFSPNNPCTRAQIVTFLYAAAGKPPILQDKTVILHTNDTHGALMGFAQVAQVKKDLEAEGAKVLLVDAGDFSQGTTYVSTNKGAAAVKVMNAAGYDVVTLGNHEFDFGFEQLMQNLESKEFTALCADVFYKGTDDTILPTSIAIASNGLKIGFFGMETPETQTKVNPGLITEIEFGTNENGKFLSSARNAIAELKDAGADLIIGVVHLGVDAESEPYRSVDLYNEIKDDVDFLIDGHSHTVMTEGPNGEPIQSTGTKASKTALMNVGYIQIDNKNKTIDKNELVALGEDAPVDEEVAAMVQEIMDAVDAEYGQVFAQSLVELNGDKAPGNRNMETNLGDLITDSMRWGVLKDMDADTLGVPEANVVAFFAQGFEHINLTARQQRPYHFKGRVFCCSTDECDGAILYGSE